MNIRYPDPGTYSSFRLSRRSENRLYNWCKFSGIKNYYPPEEFHITICYSKKPVPYQALGLLPPMPVKPKGFSIFGKENEYLVLEVICPFAVNRNQYAQLIGAVSDFPDYKPHISIAKNHGLESTEDLPPLDFLLYLHSEETKDLDPDYGAKIDKKVESSDIALKRIEAYLCQVGNYSKS